MKARVALCAAFAFVAVLGAAPGTARAETLCSPQWFSVPGPGTVVSFLALSTDTVGPITIEARSTTPGITIDNVNPTGNIQPDGTWKASWNSWIQLTVGEVPDGTHKVIVEDSTGATVCEVEIEVGAVTTGGGPTVILPPATTLAPEVVDSTVPADASDGSPTATTEAPDTEAAPTTTITPGALVTSRGDSFLARLIDGMADVGRAMLVIIVSLLTILFGMWGIRRIVRAWYERVPDGWEAETGHAVESLERPVGGPLLPGRRLEQVEGAAAEPARPVIPPPLRFDHAVYEPEDDPENIAEDEVAEPDDDHAQPEPPGPDDDGRGGPVVVVDDRDPTATDTAAEPAEVVGADEPYAESRLVEPPAKTEPDHAPTDDHDIDPLWDLDTFEPERLKDRVEAVTAFPLQRTAREDLPRPVRRSRRSAARRLAQFPMAGGARQIRGPSMIQRWRLSKMGRRYGRWVARPRIKGPSMLGRLRNAIIREQRTAAPRWEPPAKVADVVDVRAGAKPREHLPKGVFDLPSDPFEEKIG